MKWATKKSSSSSLINRVFPVSWFSKFKKKGGGGGGGGGGGDHDSNSAKLSSNTELNRPSPIPSRYRRGRFYSMDEDDAFWRISFGGDSLPPRRSCGGANDHEDRVFSEFTSLGLGEGGASRNDGECRNFSEMVSDVRKMREREVRETKDVHLKEIKMRSESHLKRRKENSYKANSPRTELRIRALEKMKRRAKKERFDSVFDSFAVVKSSVDPQRDFKDSMVEMIREKGIGHPDELEQLLACYLTLNCDEYHDLIISVFRQVWIEEKGVC